MAMKGTSKSFPLRLPASLRQHVHDFADREGISANQFISIAVAEKVGRMEEQGRADKELGANAKQPSASKGLRPIIK
jgi:hypothetical protein